jgi:hypothetical protein
MPLHVSGVTRPSSGGSARMLFGVITSVGCVLTTGRLGWNRNLHILRTSYARNYTKQHPCRASWRWASKARNMYRHWLLINKLRVYQAGIDSVLYHDARSTKHHIQKHLLHCHNIQNKHRCFRLNKKASSFRNVAFVLNTVTTEIVISNVGDTTHVKPLSKMCMLQWNKHLFKYIWAMRSRCVSMQSEMNM